MIPICRDYSVWIRGLSRRLGILQPNREYIFIIMTISRITDANMYFYFEPTNSQIARIINGFFMQLTLLLKHPLIRSNGYKTKNYFNKNEQVNHALIRSYAVYQ